MPVQPDRYACLFASERLLAGIGGQPPFKGCGISSDWHLTAMASLGESTLNADGSIKSVADRKEDLARGWHAFKAQPDSNGIPDSGDLIRIHHAMFPRYPNPAQFESRNFSEVIDLLDAGQAFSIALRLSVLGPTNTVDQTTADHQITMFRRKGDFVTVMGPMHLQRNGYHGHDAKVLEIRKAALAIENGLVIGWHAPIGAWTAASLETDDLSRQLSATQKVAKSLRDRLEQCQAGQVPDCNPALVAERRAIIADIEARGV